MNASSVHLRDLNNLVSAFYGDSHLGSDGTRDPSRSTRLLAVDGFSSYEEDKPNSSATTFSSKIYCPTNTQLQSQLITHKIEHRTSAKNSLLAAKKESNDVHFGKQWQTNGTELISLDSSSAIETDLPETPNGKNSLDLISELCDRFAASDSAEKDKNDKGTQTVMVDTPNNSETYFSYAAPQSQTNVQVPTMEISTAFGKSLYQSCSSTLSDSHVLMRRHKNDATENSFDDFLAQRQEPCGTYCEPAGTVSCLEHLIERITPPLSCATPGDETYKPCVREISTLFLDIKSSDGLTNSNSGR